MTAIRRRQRRARRPRGIFLPATANRWVFTQRPGRRLLVAWLWVGVVVAITVSVALLVALSWSMTIVLVAVGCGAIALLTRWP